MAKRNPDKVTLKDLARELGMSDRSVSQALRPRESNVKLSKETIDKVQKLAAKRGYKVNAGARAVRYGKHFNIGYFEGKSTPNSFPLRGALSGVCDVASEHGYRVVITTFPATLSAEHNAIPHIFRESHLDALIVTHAGNLPPSFVEAIDESGLPVVYLNEKKKLNSVYVDDIAGGQMLTRHLIEQGYRKICYFDAIHPEAKGGEHYSVRDHLAGYEGMMQTSGLKPRVVEVPWSDLPSQSDRILKAIRGADAIICAHELLAMRFLRVVYENHGRVPDDFGLATFGDDFSSYAIVPLTTICIPFYEIGKAAASMAIELATNAPANGLASVKFSPFLRAGGSVSRKPEKH